MELVQNKECLESEQEYLKCCFKVIDKQIELAKASLYLNPHHIIDGLQACAIGHVSCVNDDEVFSFLMGGIRKEAERIGGQMIIGPMNGSTWNEYRLVTSHREKSFLLDVITPHYHIDLYKNYGFKIIKEYRSTLAEEIVDNWETLAARHREFSSQGIHFRGFRRSDAEAEFRKLWALCNDSFSDNFLFSPISEEDFVRKMIKILPLVNPRYTILAEYQEEVVGFIFCYPDRQDSKSETIVVKTLARANGEAFRGIGSLLSGMAMKAAKEDGFTKGIHALMAISNTSTYISNKFKSNEYQKYALMGLKI